LRSLAYNVTDYQDMREYYWDCYLTPILECYLLKSFPISGGVD
jgi:hypothetical protein